MLQPRNQVDLFVKPQLDEVKHMVRCWVLHGVIMYKIYYKRKCNIITHGILEIILEL
jgi:hypothetical protein